MRLNEVRFLGRGPEARVRPGCVLVAPTHEFHHYYRQSAIFIHAMGEDDDGEYVIRGVILDHPTPFTLKEMMDQNEHLQENPLGMNLLHRGGDKGGATDVILLHDQQGIGQVGIGESGVYTGGWDAAIVSCASGLTKPDRFKLFFGYCEFTEQEIEDLLDSEEDGDAWVSVEVDPDFVLSAEYDRGDAWAKLRNSVAQQDYSE